MEGEGATEVRLKLRLKRLCFAQVFCEENIEGRKKILRQQKTFSISKCSVVEPEL